MSKRYIVSWTSWRTGKRNSARFASRPGAVSKARGLYNDGQIEISVFDSSDGKWVNFLRGFA